MSDLCKVLIVDDEYLVRQGIKHLLNWEEEGFQMVGEAGNGREALDMVSVLRPHIVITDIVMPVMDGEEFARQLKATYPEIEIIVLSSFSEFEYVKSTFQSGVADYILKPTLETEGLLHVLRATADKIPSLKGRGETLKSFIPTVDHIMDKLIAGYETDVDVSSIRDTFPYGEFCLLGCRLDYLFNKDQNEISSYKSSLATEISRYLSSDQVSYHMIQMEPTLFVALLNFRDTEWEHVIDLLRTMSTALGEKVPECCWVVGDRFHHLDQLGNEYRESFLKQLDYAFYFPDRTIIIASELPVVPKIDVKFNLNHLTDELKRKHTDTAFEYLQNHVGMLAGQYKNDVFEFKSFLSNIIFVIITLLDSYEIDTVLLNEEKYTYFRKMDEAKVVSDAVSLLQSFLDKVRQMIASMDNKDSIRVQQLLDYMHEHYAEQLTLAELSGHFHFNTSYLSSYFSAHTKEGFSEYLNKIRIEKATELLNDVSIMISDISARVGYSDHSYFCKVFKKFTGDAPSAYRRKYKKQEK
ncbi:response regulator transcription factor [Paenibacillus sp. FA6]|uniref:response regulator transcription factor n=1 Tax=Paenibacillus sp. FA6 TaxID=3413029 RepID=UPI003F6598F4